MRLCTYFFVVITNFVVIFCGYPRWRYVITGVLEVNVKPSLHMWSWQHIRHHRQHVKKYREIYKNKITSKKPAESLLKEFEVGEHWAFSDTVHTMKICCYLLIVMLFQTHMLLFFLLSRRIAAFFLSLIAVITMNCLFDLANIAVFWFGVWYNELTNISLFCFVFIFCFGILSLCELANMAFLNGMVHRLFSKAWLCLWGAVYMLCYKKCII